MYTVQWAKEFTGFSKENPIDLKKFANFYEEHIADFQFEYHTTNPQIPMFSIESRGNQLPHLMGLQHWNNLSTTQASIQYDHMLTGDWDLDLLQSADEGAWQKFREKIEFTPHLYNLLYNCECTIKLVHPTMASPFKNRKIDMFFQKEHKKLVFALELREIGENIFKPTSLTTHRKNSDTLRGKHLPIKVNEINITSI